MDPSAPLQDSSGSLGCDVCNRKFESQQALCLHYGDDQHKKRSRAVAQCLFGYAPAKPMNCLADMYNYCKTKGAFVGLHYLRECSRIPTTPTFSCILCGIKGSKRICGHVLGLMHKRRYIQRDFELVFVKVGDNPPEFIEKIAAIIAEVEGPQRFKITVANSKISIEKPSYQVIDIFVNQLIIHNIKCIRPDRLQNDVPVLETGSHSSRINEKKTITNPSEHSESPAPPENDNMTEKEQIYTTDFKQPYHKEIAVPYLGTGPHYSETNENNIIRNPSAPSENSSRQKVNDKIEKLQIHSKNPPPEKGTVPCSEIGSHYSGINESNVKRCSKFSPPAGLVQKKCKFTEKPIVSLSRPVPVPYSFSQTSASLPVGDKMHENHSLRSNELPTMTYTPLVNKDMAPKPNPFLYRSYPTSWPPVEHFLSWPPAGSFYQNAECGYGHYSDQNLHEFAVKSAPGQASLSSNIGHAFAAEGQNWGQETRRPFSQRFHTSDFLHNSPSGQFSSEASVKQDTPSRYGYNSVNSRTLYSQSSLPSGIMPVLNKEPNLPMSRGVIHPEGLSPITSTSSSVQTSQSTSISMPAKTASMLSFETLKILQGRDPASVKSILKQLAKYCPELQQVNISLLVDVLFEAGALSWVPV